MAQARGAAAKAARGVARGVRDGRIAADDRHGRDAILERIYDAILEHRLPPGTKLAEERLAEIFGASRARIREVLARLAHEQVVSLVPQRGAFVARPTPEQAHDVFEARRLIEPAIVARLIGRLAPDDLESLRRHLVLERDARRRSDERAIVRLSGEFHTLLAERAGNSAYLRTMRELSTLTCLIIFLYDAPTATSCRADEHAAIVDAIGRREVAKASALMLAHLEHIEKSLRLQSVETEIDLATVFGP